MSQSFVLVIGSKPDIYVPFIDFQKIYCANGAAERALLLRQRRATNIIAVTAEGGLKTEPVRNRIEALRPDELLTVNGKVKLDLYFSEEWCSNVRYRFIEKKGYAIQKRFFGLIAMNFADFGMVRAGPTFTYGLARLLRYRVWGMKRPLGLSTGALCILIALEENPSRDILVAGLSFSSGKHFYEYDGIFPAYRGITDRLLLNKLPKKDKRRLYTNDEELANDFSINLISSNHSLIKL
jgi:hypothetical protein